ncbi:MAG: hypothetical protein V4671_03475, partial [Armatimonadota bacterium]
HALTVTLANGRKFTELLTCLPPNPAASSGSEQAGRGREWAIPGRPGADWEREFEENGITGTVRLHHVPLTPELNHFQIGFSPHDTLHEPFPSPTGEPAWTRVGWKSDDTCLTIETIHTYPEDGAGIRSTTILHLSDG